MSTFVMKTTTKPTSITSYIAAFAAGALLLCSFNAYATNYPGNGIGGWGGSVSKGTLSVTDDGTNITFSLQRGSGTLDNALVIYIDTGAGGFADTSGFTDTGDGGRIAVSGYNGGANRSTLTFTSGFRPSYAISIDQYYASLFHLVSGGSHGWITGTGQSGNSSANFTLTISAAQIGLTNGSTANVRIFGTLIAESAWRSQETIAGTATTAFGDGYNPFTQTTYGTYVFSAPVTPTYPVTFQVDMTAQIATGAFNPAGGDTVYAAGSFQASPWSGFQLNPSVGNTNIYTGTYQDANPLGTAEQYKFHFHNISGNSDSWDSDPNRQFTLHSGGQVLPVVYFNNIPASPSATTNAITFQIDMEPQIYLGHFNPANGDTIQVFGSFQSPSWSGGFILTNNPSISASNIYSGTFVEPNYPGTIFQYKYVIISGGNNNYETGNDRYLVTPTNAATLPLAYFNGVSNIYATPITFQVDMTVPILTGGFVPANGDTVTAAGTFQSNVWTAGVFVLTNNPNAANTNIYTGVFVDLNQPGSGEQFKFQINPAGNPANANWEGVANRTFLLGSTAQTLPLAFWNNLNPKDVLSAETIITFTVNMTNAVDVFGSAFNPDNDLVMVDGDFTNPQWPVMGNATDPLINSDYSANVLQNIPGTQLYAGTFTVPAGHSLQVTYKYGIYHNTASVNTNVDNEAGTYLNHTRYIRTAGTYNFPVDTFGLQRSNLTAATEPSFGALAIGAPVGGHLPISWLGRPGVHLQAATNLVNATWLDLNATDGASLTNWPQSSGYKFFRLVKP